MSLKTNLYSLRLLCLLAAIPFPGASVAAQTISTGWAIVSGTAEVERTAAQILQRELAARHRARVEIADAPAQAGADIIYIGTTATLHAIAAAHVKSPFKLDAADPESYHAATRGGALYIAGASPKGAMNGVFRFLEKNTPGISGLDQAESPAFRHRVGGHLINQHPPPEWTEDMQAEYYASHYINVLWGEKHPAPLSPGVRKKYGLGIMVEARFPHGGMGAWLADPANRDAIFSIDPAKKRPNLWSDPKGIRVVSPFAPAGRRWYFELYKKLLRESPDVKIIYNMFADYNTLPETTDSYNTFTKEPYAHSIEDTIMEVLKIAREAALDADPKSGIVPHAWLWQSFWNQRGRERAFMRRLQKEGFGIMYNEAGDGDNWLTVRDNFTGDALLVGPDGKSAHGPNYLVIVSAGGACESLGSSVAFPLPAVAGHKLSRLAAAGAGSFILWWSSVEGWTYDANMEVIARMIWNPGAFDYKNPRPFDAATGEPLLREIAARDFGPLADGVLDFWREFDRAIVWNGKAYAKTDGAGDTGWFIRDWHQRLGVFLRPYTEYGAAYPLPLVPAALQKRKEVQRGKLWLHQPEVLENVRVVIADVGASLDKLRALENSAAATPDIRRRLAETRRWVDLFRHLLASQRNFFRACGAMRRHAGDEAALRREMEPPARDEIANDESLIQLMREFHPWASASLGTTKVRFQTEPRRDEEIKILQEKIAAMRAWLAPSS